MNSLLKISFLSISTLFAIQFSMAQAPEVLYEEQDQTTTDEPDYKFIGDINSPNFVSDFSDREATRTFEYSKGYNPRGREGFQLFENNLPMNIEWNSGKNIHEGQVNTFNANNGSAGNLPIVSEQQGTPAPVHSSEMTSQKSVVEIKAAPNSAPRNMDAIPDNPGGDPDAPVNSAVYVLALAAVFLGFKFKSILQ